LGPSDAQVSLSFKAMSIGAKVRDLRKTGQYRQALQELAALRSGLDAFFASVMVMDPDPAIRETRLTLLAQIVNDSSDIADFSEIVTQG